MWESGRVASRVVSENADSVNSVRRLQGIENGIADGGIISGTAREDVKIFFRNWWEKLDFIY